MKRHLQSNVHFTRSNVHNYAADLLPNNYKYKVACVPASIHSTFMPLKLQDWLQTVIGIILCICVSKMPCIYTTTGTPRNQVATIAVQAQRNKRWPSHHGTDNRVTQNLYKVQSFSSWWYSSIYNTVSSKVSILFCLTCRSQSIFFDWYLLPFALFVRPCQGFANPSI